MVVQVPKLVKVFIALVGSVADTCGQSVNTARRATGGVHDVHLRCRASPLMWAVNFTFRLVPFTHCAVVLHRGSRLMSSTV